MNWLPLLEYRRNGVTENTIHAAVAWVHGNEVLHLSASDVVTYARSLMKPLYMKTVAAAVDPLLTSEQKALSLASHNGQAFQVRVSESILKDEDKHLLKTPADTPLVPEPGVQPVPSPWINNSSGNHAGLIRGAQALGWSVSDYTMPSHPIFQKFQSVLRDYLGSSWKPMQTARDGDGLPTPAMQISEIAAVYAGLVRDRDKDWIWSAMTSHPDLIGGPGRPDTTILANCSGRVIAKEGADGLLGLGIQHPAFPKGLGIVIKTAAGWNPQAAWYLASCILGVLDFEIPLPKSLRRQSVFVNEAVVPANLRSRLSLIRLNPLSPELPEAFPSEVKW